MTPFVQMLRINPKLPRERLRALPAQHPLDCRKLKLPAENTAPSLGHSFSLRELVPYILVSLSGGTPGGKQGDVVEEGAKAMQPAQGISWRGEHVDHRCLDKKPGMPSMPGGIRQFQFHE